MSDIIIQVENMSKRFGKIQALNNVSIQVGTGTIIGLVGANGSGKSTLLRHIIGMYLPDAGSCVTYNTVAGDLGPDQLAKIGYVHQEGQLLDWMKVRQHIDYVAAYYENWNKELEERYIEDFNVDVDKRVGTLSPGQRQMLAILLAIGHEPSLLILDEPASALDPIARGRFLDLLLKIIQDEGRTIIISSHILSDIEKVIDYVLIMDEGRMVRDCSFDDLKEEFCKIKVTSLNGKLPDAFDMPGILEIDKSEMQAVMTVIREDYGTVADKAKSLNCRLETESLSLEEIYRIVMR